MKRKFNFPMFILGILSVIMVAGCKKSSSTPDTANVSIVGFWSGNSNYGNESQIFNKDGTTVEYNFYNQNSTDTATCLYKGYGTYTQTGNSFTFSIKFPSVNTSFIETGTINTSVTPNTMSGRYTGSQSGSFSLTRQ